MDHRMGFSIRICTCKCHCSRELVSVLRELLKIFGMSIPDEFLHGPWEGGYVNIPAIIIVCLLSLLLIRGTKESSTVNNLLVILKVSVVLIFIGLGWSFINPANHTPFIPANEGEELLKSGKIGWGEFFKDGYFGNFGISGVFRAAGVLFFAFVGFDAVSTAAQEAKNPKKECQSVSSVHWSSALYYMYYSRML